MSVNATSVFGQNATRIREIINSSMNVLLPELDPIWRNTIASSQGVYPMQGLGRDMLVNKVFMGSFAGVIDNAAARGEFPLYGDTYTGQVNAAKLYTQGTPANTYPDPTEGPNPKPYRMTFPMRALLANISLTIGEVSLDQQASLVGDVLAAKFIAFGRHNSHYLSLYSYLSQNSNYSLGTVADSTFTAVTAITFTQIGSTTNYSATVYIKEKALDRFYQGQRLDLMISDSSSSYTTAANQKRVNDSTATVASQTPSTRQQLVVVAVDENNGSITLQTSVQPTGSGAVWATDPATTLSGKIFYLTHANMRTAAGAFTGIAGINSYLKGGDSSGSTITADNTILGTENINDSSLGGAINVNVHPEHKSHNYTSFGSLTEHRLRLVLQAFNRAKQRYGFYVDTGIASDGVWLNYMGSRIASQYQERFGQEDNLKGQGGPGENGFDFHYNGRTIKLHTSNYVESGVAYFLRLGNQNFQRLTPPTRPGSQKLSETDSFIPFEFTAGILTGTNSPRLPYRNSSARPTDMIEMPGDIRMQLVCDKQFAGIKLNGVTEDRVYPS